MTTTTDRPPGRVAYAKRDPESSEHLSDLVARYEDKRGVQASYPMEVQDRRGGNHCRRRGHIYGRTLECCHRIELDLTQVSHPGKEVHLVGEVALIDRAQQGGIRESGCWWGRRTRCSVWNALIDASRLKTPYERASRAEQWRRTAPLYLVSHP